MADNKDRRGARDRATVSGSETYELDYFADKHGISREAAQNLIDRVGNSRDALERAVADDSKSSQKTRAARTTSRTNANRKQEPARPGKAAARATADKSSKAAAPATRRIRAAAHRSESPSRRVAPTGRAAAGKAPKSVGTRAKAAVDSARAVVTGRAASIVGVAAAGIATGLAVNLGRKLIVQAPSALAGDWLEALKTEHKLALGLFDQLQATTNGDVGTRSVLLTQLKHALGKHAFTEENVIYPALRAWGDTADADKLNHDHGYVKQYLYDLENMDNGSSAFGEKVDAFRAELEAHIREEEDAIFPPLHRALGATRNAKLTAQANKEGFKLA